jgi:hypothetical protein
LVNASPAVRFFNGYSHPSRDGARPGGVDVRDLLELLHRPARENAECGHLVYREWALRTRPRESLSGADVLVDRPRLQRLGDGGWAHVSEEIRQIWFSRPDLLRVEILRSGVSTRVGVRRGQRWWRWDAAEGVTSGTVSSAGDLAAVPPMLKPGVLAPLALVAALRLVMDGLGVHGGRGVVLATGYPHNGVPHDARYALEFDAVNGTIIRRAVYRAEQCVQLTDALEVEFDLRINPAIFRFEQAPLSLG